MNKKLILLINLIFLIGLTGFIFVDSVFAASQKCGDDFCNAGQYNLDGNEIEDASTCFQDCAGIGYSICRIDLNKGGGICPFKGMDYIVNNIVIGGTTLDAKTDLSVSFGSNKKDLSIQIGTWNNLNYDVDILIDWRATNELLVYFKGILDRTKYNDFLNINKELFNLKKDSVISATYNFPSPLTTPYCKSELRNYDTQEVITSNSGLGCSNWDISLDSPSFKPGKYVIIGELLDKNAQNKLGEKSLQFKINECQENKECSDNNFLTVDSCSDNDVKTCQSRINYLLIGGIIVAVVLIILLFLLIRRKT